MEWVKLYTRMPRDPAIRAAQLRHPHAGWLFMLGLCYVGEQETDGMIPAAEPSYWSVPRWKTAADALVAEGLWDALLEGGWHVVKYLDLQQSKAQAEASRRAAADRQSRHRSRTRDAVSNGVTDGVSHATRGEESREPPLPPQAGGASRSACERHRARPKAGCSDCQRPAPTRPAETRLEDLCDLHGRDASTCPFCQLPLEAR